MNISLISSLATRRVENLRLLLVAAVVALALSVIAPPATASSGTLVITSDTTLTEDHHGNIVIEADNVTLDCAGHTVQAPDMPVQWRYLDSRPSGQACTVKRCLWWARRWERHLRRERVE